MVENQTNKKIKSSVMIMKVNTNPILKSMSFCQKHGIRTWEFTMANTPQQGKINLLLK